MFSLQKFGFALIPPCGGHKQRFKIGQKYAKIGWFNPLLRQFHANYGSFFWCLGVPISGQIHMGDLSKWMRLWVNPDVSRQKKDTGGMPHFGEQVGRAGATCSMLTDYHIWQRYAKRYIYSLQLRSPLNGKHVNKDLLVPCFFPLKVGISRSKFWMFQSFLPPAQRSKLVKLQVFRRDGGTAPLVLSLWQAGHWGGIRLAEQRNNSQPHRMGLSWSIYMRKNNRWNFQYILH